jgi:HK97 family phage major capsid protein
MIDVTRLTEKRQRKLDRMDEIVAAAEGEDRGLNEAEQREFDQLETSVQDLTGRIQRAEAANEREERDAQPAGTPPAHQRTQPETPPGAEIGMSEREVQQYSLVRAIRAQVGHQLGQRGALDEAGFEMELSQEVARRTGRQPRGFFVPFDVQVRGRATGGQQQRGQERRDLSVGTPTAGGNLVATELLAASFIELLRNRMVVRQAGATMLTGLMGDIAIPRQTGGATAYWVGEGTAPTESQQTVDQVALAPETVGAFTDYTRKLLLQSSIDVEQFVRMDLSSIIAIAVDYAALHGDSNSDPNQPDGIENTSGIGSVVGGDPDGGAPVWADIVNLETEVAVDNADVGRLAYITNARVRGKLKQTEKASNTALFVWTEAPATPLNGYNAWVTNQVRSNIEKGGSGATLSAIFFGNWADLILAFWSGLDILVDPFTHSTTGTVRVVALQDADIAVRHAQSFAAMLDAVTT